MNFENKRAAALAGMRRLMAARIKLDIARTLRQHPHLTEEASAAAFAELASDTTVDRLVADMAREEVQDAVTRGELPAASFLRLAGFHVNELPEG